MESIDQASLNFSEQNIQVLNLSLAFIMFGVALKLTLHDFKMVLKQPISALIGAFSQFFVLPFLTFVFIWIVEPRPSFALGMILVAACPGGNISNFFSAMSRGNVGLSVSLTAISSVGALIMTPFNLSFYASLYPPTAGLLHNVSVEFLDVFQTITLILGLPICLGMFVRNRFPAFAQKLHPYMHYGSIAIFATIVILAFSANFDLFITYIHLVLILVFFHNAIALLSGYGLGKLFSRPEDDCRTLAIETGIQNSGLGLVLIFAFFDGLGGMAIIAAWWGIWHIIAGLSLSYFWNYKKLSVA